FTLVELLVVVTIVGILSAVALPSFLSQTDKAKATEAKTMISATLKQGQAKWLEDNDDPEDAIADMNTTYGTPLNDATNFNYSEESFDTTNNIWTLTAVASGASNVDSGKAISGCANFETGKVVISSQLAASVTAAETAIDGECDAS
ncbi:type II secretion system GspH family protein, partial [Synechococcus sp. AH-551-G15]|nr:type II secretion system GspH family protein [Synechococcus sp. AH-551-G15]